MKDEFLLTLKCPDRPGLVSEVTTWLTSNQGNILEAHQFNDQSTERFFMRIDFEAAGQGTIGRMYDSFVRLAEAREMTWSLRRKRELRRVVIMVSKLDHCLVDLLYRNRIGELPMDIVGVISNHPQNVVLASALHAIPFHHLPVTRETKSRQEAQIKSVISESEAEVVILARYMQILSDDLASYLSGRCINIHHSFLPGFKGAMPYHQAHARGVKMIGATAHYVTADLDEGPIIYQDVEPVTHADTPEDMVRKGRDIERRVLAQAVRLHLQDRVILDGAKTVVFQA